MTRLAAAVAFLLAIAGPADSDPERLRNDLLWSRAELQERESDAPWYEGRRTRLRLRLELTERVELVLKLRPSPRRIFSLKIRF